MCADGTADASAHVDPSIGGFIGTQPYNILNILDFIGLYFVHPGVVQIQWLLGMVEKCTIATLIFFTLRVFRIRHIFKYLGSDARFCVERGTKELQLQSEIVVEMRYFLKVELYSRYEVK